MLTHAQDGRLCLEDPEGKVILDISETVGYPRLASFCLIDAYTAHSQGPSEGLFTEGCFVLVEGDYTEDEIFQVIAMGHPPSEKRVAAR